MNHHHLEVRSPIFYLGSIMTLSNLSQPGTFPYALLLILLGWHLQRERECQCSTQRSIADVVYQRNMFNAVMHLC